MKALDSNVLVRLLVQDDPEQAALALEAVRRCTPKHPGFIAVVTVVELYWVLSRSYRIPKAQVLDAIAELARADGVRIERSAEVLAALSAAEAGADLGDALIDAVARSEGCDAVVTFDRGAAKRLGWELLD